MNTQDLLNILLVVGFLIIVVCIIFVTFYLVLALKSIAKLSESLEDTAQEVKNKLQMRALAVIPPLVIGLVSRIFKRGGR